MDARRGKTRRQATTTNGVNGVKHSTPRVDLPDDEDDWEPLETTETWFNFTEDAQFANADEAAKSSTRRFEVCFTSYYRLASAPLCEGTSV